MDIRCPKCAEPWDMEELHYVAEEKGETFEVLAAMFRRVGCEVFGTSHGETLADGGRAALVWEVMGDDLDGAAAMFEDMEALGW